MRKMYSLKYLQDLIKNSPQLMNGTMWYDYDDNSVNFDSDIYAENINVSTINKGNLITKIDLSTFFDDYSQYYDSLNDLYNIPRTDEYFQEIANMFRGFDIPWIKVQVSNANGVTTLYDYNLVYENNELHSIIVNPASIGERFIITYTSSYFQVTYRQL